MNGHGRGGSPAADIHATTRRYDAPGDGGRFVIAVDLADFHEDEIRAEHSQEAVHIRAGRDELGRPRVSKTFQMPPAARTQDTTARLNHGVLVVDVPLDGRR